MNSEDEQRLIDLEIKISHQEAAIEELQNVVYASEGKIEKLEKSLKLLTQRFEDAFGGKDIGPANERPPHY